MSREAMKQQLQQRYLLASDMADETLYSANYGLIRWVVSHITKMYNFPIEPEVFIVIRDNNNASATRLNDGYALIIPTGLIDFLHENYKIDFISSISVDADDVILATKGLLIDLSLIFIASHEYIHVANRHLDYIYTNREIIEDVVFWGFEYDADCYSVVILYRYIRLSAPKISEALAIKLLAISLYWSMRLFIPNIDIIGRDYRKHPSFGARLKYCIYKMLSIDNIAPNRDYLSKTLAEKRLDIILDAFQEQEKFFSNSIPNKEENFIREFLNNESIDNQVKVSHSQWEWVKKLLSESCEGVKTGDGERLDWKFEGGRFSIYYNG